MLISLVLYGGEGEIRTPDSLATMSDSESGAFNRALPPLRFVTPVPEQFRDGTQIDSGHNQPTCKSMAVAMPRRKPFSDFHKKPAWKPCSETVQSDCLSVTV